MTRLRLVAFFAFVAVFLFALNYLGDDTSPRAPEPETMGAKRPDGGKKAPLAKIPKGSKKLQRMKPSSKSPSALSRRVIFRSKEVRAAHKNMIHGPESQRRASAAMIIAAQLGLGRELVARCSKEGAKIPGFAAALVAKNEELRARLTAVLPDFETRGQGDDTSAGDSAERVLRRLSSKKGPLAEGCRQLEKKPEVSALELLPPDLFPRAHEILMKVK